MRVLIAHPVDASRTFLRQRLAAAGCSCEEADGETTLFRRLDAQAPDLLICALDLLKAEGWRCLRALKKRASLKQIAVLGVCDVADAGEEAQAKQLGMAELLVTPLLNSDAVAALLHRYRQAAEPAGAPDSPPNSRPKPEEKGEFVVQSWSGKSSSSTAAVDPGGSWGDAELLAAFESIGKPLERTREDRLANGATAVEYRWKTPDGRRTIDLKTLGCGARIAQRSLSLSGDWDANFDDVEEALTVFAEHCIPASALQDFQTLINQMDAETDCKVEGPSAVLRASRLIQPDYLQLRISIEFHRQSA